MGESNRNSPGLPDYRRKISPAVSRAGMKNDSGLDALRRGCVGELIMEADCTVDFRFDAAADADSGHARLHEQNSQHRSMIVRELEKLLRHRFDHFLAFMVYSELDEHFVLRPSAHAGKEARIAREGEV